jgi:hypothetical protein
MRQPVGSHCHQVRIQLPELTACQDRPFGGPARVPAIRPSNERTWNEQRRVKAHRGQDGQRQFRKIAISVVERDRGQLPDLRMSQPVHSLRQRHHLSACFERR